MDAWVGRIGGTWHRADLSPVHPCVHADLPGAVLAHLLSILDGPSRLALLATCHALAAALLAHGPGRKALCHQAGSKTAPRWSTTLVDLLTSKWQPPAGAPPLSLELQLGLSTPTYRDKPQPLPRLPPPALRQLVTHLHLRLLSLSAADLQLLRDPQQWPAMRHVTLHRCAFPAKAPPASSSSSSRGKKSAGASETAAAAPAPALPLLEKLTVMDEDGSLPPWALHGLLVLAPHLASLDLELWGGGASEQLAGALQRLPTLTHARLGDDMTDEVAAAVLGHPRLEHVTLLDELRGLERDHHHGGGGGGSASRLRTLTLPSGLDCQALARLQLEQLPSLERVTVVRFLRAWADEDTEAAEREAVVGGLAALERLQAAGRLVVEPLAGGSDALHAWRLPGGGGGGGASAGAVQLQCSPGLLARAAGAALRAARPAAGALVLPLNDVPLEAVRRLAGDEGLAHGGAALRTLCVFAFRQPDDYYGEGVDEEEAEQRGLPLAREVEEPWAGFLAALPASMERVKVRVDMHLGAARLRALVGGGGGSAGAAEASGAAGGRPLSVELIDDFGGVGQVLETDLRRLAAGRRIRGRPVELSVLRRRPGSDEDD